MKNNGKGFRARLLVVFVAICSVVGSLVALASNLTAVLTFFHISAPAKLDQKPSVNAVPAATNAPVPDQPVGRGTSPATQHPTGAQSPNVNDTQGSVGLGYSAAKKGQAASPAASTAKKAIPASSSVVQSSTGAQSPNINNVGGDLKMEYNSNTAPAPAKD